MKKLADTKYEEAQNLYVYGITKDGEAKYPALRELAEQFGIPLATMGYWAKKGGWLRLRDEAAREAVKEVVREEISNAKEAGIASLATIIRQNSQIYDSIIKQGLSELISGNNKVTTRDLLIALSGKTTLYKVFCSDEIPSVVNQIQLNIGTIPDAEQEEVLKKAAVLRAKTL